MFFYQIENKLDITIFNRFQQRNRERIAHAMKLLETEPDWTLDESFEFDREHAAWPANVQELNELWRKRVKNDGLSLLLTGKTWPEAVDILRKRYERVLKRADQVTASEVFENLMNAYARSFDPHSSYFSARNSEEYRIQMSLSYEGIGATLQSSDDQVSIVNLVSGGPAAVDGAAEVDEGGAGRHLGRQHLARVHDRRAGGRPAGAHARLRGAGVAYLSRRPWGTFSQGERQRVFICRALMARPALLLLDDVPVTGDPLEELSRAPSQHGGTRRHRDRGGSRQGAGS